MSVLEKNMSDVYNIQVAQKRSKLPDKQKIACDHRSSLGESVVGIGGA